MLLARLLPNTLVELVAMVRAMVKVVTLIALLSLANPVLAQRVAFINPGLTGEAFWTSAARAMEAAAKDLGMTLEVQWAERQFPKALDIARTIAERPAQAMPDVVVIVNEGGAGPELLRLLAPRTKVFMAFSGIDTPAEVAITGAPRERFPNWIGSLEPVAEQAGHQVASELIRKAREAGLRGPDGRIHLLAISGDRSTPTSVLRSQGMRRAVLEAGDVVLDQEVFAHFRRERAFEVAQVLFDRHRAARVVWAGSDQMAFGAMQALQQRGLTPGRDALFGGINTSAEAMQALREGRLSALSGGHFILGAWAMVLIHDHLRGADFAATEGLRIQAPMFTRFTPATAEVFTRRFGGDDFSGVDFSRFSKARNPGIARYDFGFDPLLR
jgi:ABC-type sugar transport system substrate-binding protein